MQSSDGRAALLVEWSFCREKATWTGRIKGAETACCMVALFPRTGIGFECPISTPHLPAKARAQSSAWKSPAGACGDPFTAGRRAEQASPFGPVPVPGREQAEAPASCALRIRLRVRISTERPAFSQRRAPRSRPLRRRHRLCSASPSRQSRPRHLEPDRSNGTPRRSIRPGTTC